MLVPSFRSRLSINAFFVSLGHIISDSSGFSGCIRSFNQRHGRPGAATQGDQFPAWFQKTLDHALLLLIHQASEALLMAFFCT